MNHALKALREDFDHQDLLPVYGHHMPKDHNDENEFILFQVNHPLHMKRSQMPSRVQLANVPDICLIPLSAVNDIRGDDKRALSWNLAALKKENICVPKGGLGWDQTVVSNEFKYAHSEKRGDPTFKLPEYKSPHQLVLPTDTKKYYLKPSPDGYAPLPPDDLAVMSSPFPSTDLEQPAVQGKIFRRLYSLVREFTFSARYSPCTTGRI
jgi:hypothetical protein